MMPSAYPSRVLALLRAGGPACGIWLSLGSVALAEIAAETRPDAIVLDLQHGSWDVVSIHAALALAAAGATPLVRVAANTPSAIGHALDAGAAGVIVPLVETAEQAASAVAAAHYPPVGVRSGGAMRPLRDFAAYAAQSRDETLVAVMIETRLGLENAAAIAGTPGVDLVFIGSGDLALSLTEDEVPLEDAIAMILAASSRAGVACGVFTGSVEAARARLAQGFAFVIADDDIRLAREGFARSLAHIRQDDRN